MRQAASLLPKRVLLVEDEPGLVVTLTDRLRAEGYAVGVASDGRTALERATHAAWDVILLDVMLPGRSGFEVCREVRRQGIVVPIIMLTARGQVADRVAGLRIGADDYISKPFDMTELLARIEVQLRRASESTDAVEWPYRFGDVIVDARSTEVFRDGRRVDLAALEFLLLKYFIEHRETTLSREELLNNVWGYDAEMSTRTVDVHVAWLRQKIEPIVRQPRYILTVHRLGYKFVG
jgi:two-component system alkaline phosphatase synthesis response regulator PhoP